MRDLLGIIVVALIALPQTSSIKKCPIECTCDMDALGRYSAVCERGTEQVIDFRLAVIQAFYDSNRQAA